MKILIFSDVHWNATSSIVRSIGTKYTVRLEQLLYSMNWVNDTAIKNNCEYMICAGDYFDKSTTSDIELTALKDIKWNDLPCYFLVGNHESSVNDLQLNTTKVLESKNHIVVSTPMSLIIDDAKISFIPYIVESNRENLQAYIDSSVETKKHIIISHNDISGIQYGYFTSVTGFNKEEIEANCDLYINGHLHNSEWISNKILNVGSLSAHNFTNDSLKYAYGAWLLDTDTLQVTFIENPYSFNFYKLTFNNLEDIKQLETLKDNAVISVSCPQSIVKNVYEFIEANPTRIVAHKVLIFKTIEAGAVSESIDDLRGTDYIERFIEFCHEKIGSSKILDEELAEVCK